MKNPKFPTKLKENKFHISSQVYDCFFDLTDTQKWNGIKGEYTSSGWQFWNRVKVTTKKIFLINSTTNENQTRSN